MNNKSPAYFHKSKNSRQDKPGETEILDEDECCLFSLELVVDQLQLHQKNTMCLFPAVAFRLLDFPVLIIYQYNWKDLTAIKRKLNTEYAGQTLPPQLTQFNKNGIFQFHKGKSTLFRMSPQKLYDFLLTTPLYIMIVDAYPEVAKLTANCLVPLDALITRLASQLNVSDLAESCSEGIRGTYPIFSLLGDSIGSITVGVKISNLGASVVPHVTAHNAHQVVSEVILDSKIQEYQQEDGLLESKYMSDKQVQVTSLSMEKPMREECKIQEQFSTKMVAAAPRSAVTITREQLRGEETTLSKAFTAGPPPVSAAPRVLLRKIIKRTTTKVHHNVFDRHAMVLDSIPPNFTSADFPVLNALVHEILRLTNMKEALPSEVEHETKRKTPKSKTVDRSQKQIMGTKSSTREKSAAKGSVPSNKSWLRQTPELGIRNTSLTFGMTNTQRLRLAKTNELLKKQAQETKERMELVNCKTKTDIVDPDSGDNTFRTPKPTPRLSLSAAAGASADNAPLSRQITTKYAPMMPPVQDETESIDKERGFSFNSDDGNSETQSSAGKIGVIGEFPRLNVGKDNGGDDRCHHHDEQTDITNLEKDGGYSVPISNSGNQSGQYNQSGHNHVGIDVGEALGLRRMDDHFSDENEFIEHDRSSARSGGMAAIGHHGHMNDSRASSSEESRREGNEITYNQMMHPPVSRSSPSMKANRTKKFNGPQVPPLRQSITSPEQYAGKSSKTRDYGHRSGVKGSTDTTNLKVKDNGEVGESSDTQSSIAFISNSQAEKAIYGSSESAQRKSRSSDDMTSHLSSSAAYSQDFEATSLAAHSNDESESSSSSLFGESVRESAPSART